MSAGHSVPDHFAVIAGLSLCQIGNRPRRQGRIDTQAILAPENQAQVCKILAAVPTPTWNTNVNDHAAIVVDSLYQGLHDAFPLKSRRMSRGYLSDDTAAKHRQTAELRHALRWRCQALKMAYVRCAFLSWRGCQSFSSLFQGRWLHSLRCSLATSALRLHFLGKSVRRACRRDRNAYLAALADQADSASPDQVHVAIRKLLKPRKYQSGPQPLPRLKTPDGALCQTHDAVMQEWRRHFGSLEGGQEVSAESLVDECIGRQDDWGVLEEVSWTELPAFADLVGALQAVHPHKAAGPDLVPPAICRRFAVPVAALMWPLLLKGAFFASEPVGFKGGTLHHIPKPAAPDRALASSQRGILVQPVLGKALHRAFRRLPAKVFEAQAAPLQIGGRQGMTYAFGSFLSRSFLAYARNRGLSAALVFSDLAAAYYAVVREVVVGASLRDDPLESILESLKLPEDALQEIQHHIQHETVFDSSCSPLVSSFLRESHVDTWFHLSQDHQVIRTRRGTRPGSCLADVLFNLLFEKVLRRRGLFGEDIVPRIPWTGRKSLELFAPESDPSPATVLLQDISYADDHASCIVSPAAASLSGAVCHVLGRSLDSIVGHGLTANFGPRKTAALLVHSGTGSRAARNAVFHGAKGKLLVLREHQSPVKVDVVPTYRHLGSIISFSGSLLPEVRARVSRAKAAFGEGRRKVFACPHIALPKRVSLFRQHILSALLAGAGAWPTLCQGSWQLLEKCLTSFCRQMVRVPHWADQHWGRDRLFVTCDMPKAEDLLASERLRFLGQLVRTGPDATWAVLQHCPLAIQAFTAACEWLYQAVRYTSNHPSPGAGWDSWLSTMQSRPKYWKGIIRRALSWHNGQRQIRVRVESFARAAWEPAPKGETALDSHEHACLLCKRALSNAQKWASHASLQHGFRAQHYIAAVGHRCRACGTTFANVRRHRTHLQVSKRCLQSVLRDDHDLLPPLQGQDGHVQSRAIPGRGTFHLPPVEEDFSPELLRQLRTAVVSTDEGLFDIVCNTIAPLQVLRNTLGRWISELPDGALRLAASDVKMCLQVDLLCDSVAPSTGDDQAYAPFSPQVLALPWSPRPAGLPGLLLHFSPLQGQRWLDLEPGGGWRAYPFHLPPTLTMDFAGAAVQLPRPPLSSGVFGDAPSCSLRVLRRHLAWLDFCLKWLAIVMHLAKSGRRCLLDLTLVPMGCHTLRDWLSTASQHECPALSVRFTF